MAEDVSEVTQAFRPTFPRTDAKELAEEPKISEINQLNIQETNRQIDLQLTAVKEGVKNHINEQGLIPEVGERGKDNGLNSEMLGYALRIAVETGDKEMFDKLKTGADSMKMENGLFKARLNKDGQQDFSRGSSWADANQDIALAYILGGQKWDNGDLIQQGREIATAFFDNHVATSGDILVPLQNPKVEEEKVMGASLRRINPSMYNYRLYEQMAQIDGNQTRDWNKLAESGLRLIQEVLDRYRLPPNNLNSVNGQIITNEDFVRDVKTGKYQNEVPENIRAAVVNLPSDSEFARSIWGFDSIRIPFRLMDCQSPEATRMAAQISQQLDALGGVKTKYYAVDGSPHPDGMRAAVVESPLAVAVLKAADGDKKKVLDRISSSTTELDKNIVYWQLWKGLGLAQLRNIDKDKVKNI